MTTVIPYKIEDIVTNNAAASTVGRNSELRRLHLNDLPDGKRLVITVADSTTCTVEKTNAYWAEMGFAGGVIVTTSSKVGARIGHEDDPYTHTVSPIVRVGDGYVVTRDGKSVVTPRVTEITIY